MEQPEATIPDRDRGGALDTSKFAPHNWTKEQREHFVKVMTQKAGEALLEFMKPGTQVLIALHTPGHPEWDAVSAATDKEFPILALEEWKAVLRRQIERNT